MGFRSGGRHLDRLETVAFREAAADGGLGRCRVCSREPSAPEASRYGDTGARERRQRRGTGRFRPVLRSLLPARSSGVKRGLRSTASSGRTARSSPGIPARTRRLGQNRAGAGGPCVGDSRAASGATRERGVRDREDRGLLAEHGRGSAARGMCPWVVSGCRSRRASPTVQRSDRPPLPKQNEVGADGT